MPQTRKNKKSKGVQSPKQNVKLRDAVSNSNMAEQNVNSNHSSLYKRTPQRDSITPVKAKRVKWVKASEGESNNSTKKQKIYNSEQSSEGNEDEISDGEVIDEQGSQDPNDTDMSAESEVDAVNTSQDDQGSDEEQLYRKEKKRVKKAKKKSMEEKINSMSNTLLAWQEIMMTNGLLPNAEGNKKKKKKQKGSDKKDPGTGETVAAIEGSSSETTIYCNVLDKQGTESIPVDSEITFKVTGNQNQVNQIRDRNCRESSSSDEFIDTSDEMMEVDGNDPFIVDCEPCRDEEVVKRQDTPKQQSDDMMRNAEAAKIRILHTPGNGHVLGQFEMPTNQQYSTVVNENYLVIGNHVDMALQEKIKRGEYVDFVKLIPRDRPVHDDNRLELINKGGHTYFLLAGDRDQVGITNFGWWEQAFHTYSNIYTKEYPERAMGIGYNKHEDTMKKMRFKYKQHYHVRLDTEFKLDCMVWINFLEGDLWSVVNRPMVDVLGTLNTSRDIKFSSDASAAPTLGYGCVLNKRWIHGDWETEFLLKNKPSIEYLELYALCMGIFTWEDSEELINCRVSVFCDNMAVVHMINSMMSGCPNCVFLICLLALNNLKFNRRVSARYISTKDNYLSDALSRRQMKWFRRMGTMMNEHPDTPSNLIWPMSKAWQLY